MLQIEQAVAMLLREAEPVVSTERLPILESVGRVLAQDCTAAADQPPFPRSPLDGYAVRGEDTLCASHERPVSLRVIGKVYAGEVFSGTVQAGEAVRLMTGAPIPDGADTVIRQEDTDYGEMQVEVYRGSRPWQNYCPQGEDYRKGDILLAKGSVLSGFSAAMLASLGMEQVEIFAKPHVGVISTGDEVIQPGEPMRPGKIYDSNRFLITARLGELGVAPALSCHCGDDARAVAEQIRSAAATCSLIITTGGVSVGEKDIMHAVVQELGARQLFWRVALKPGAPTLAMKYENTLIICLSGNPYGAAANFELLVRPVMAKLTGDPGWQMRKRKAVLTNGFSKGGVRRFLRGYTQGGEAAIVTGNQASGALSSMVRSNCLIEVPEASCGVQAGEEVQVYLL